MLPEKKLELVSLQITRNCNLHCWFCGQWGQKGFFSNASGSSMTLDDWINVVNSLIRYRNDTGYSPTVKIWGGEPLVSNDFQTVAEYLYDNGFEIEIVTNGVLIDKYADILRNKVKRIYVSIDGTREIHDSIRGEGVFDKVLSNVKLIGGGNAEIIIMTVVSPEVLDVLHKLPEVFAQFRPSKVLLQDMIYMEENELEAYKNWLGNSFGMECRDIYSWGFNLPNDFKQRKAEALSKVLRSDSPFPVIYLPHGTQGRYCLSPFRHIHIAWNGNALFCTDFYDFSAGNVKKEDIIDIFNNSLSDKFRSEIVKGNCPTCSHCSWINNKSY